MPGGHSQRVQAIRRLSMSGNKVLRIGVGIGLVGGAAELAWIAGYSALTGASGATVARGVTAAFLPGLADQPIGVGLALRSIWLWRLPSAWPSPRRSARRCCVVSANGHAAPSSF